MAARRPRDRGAALLIFLIVVVMAGLAYLVGSLTPQAVEAYRARKTQDALAQAKEALLGYALRYRDEQAAKDLDSSGDDDRVMYGYLPLPDLGSTRNGNIDPNCHQNPGDLSSPQLEGCDANTFTGIAFDANGIGPTVVGRLPWRTLGTGPLRDGHGECLWLIVSSLHGRIQRSSPPPVLPPMNWDTLGQLDIVVANGGAALASALAGAHDRPIAVIYAPGPPLSGQDRSASGSDDVSACGGNYNAANYLDPGIAAALGGVTNYLAGTNNASGTTGDSDPSNDPDAAKPLTLGGQIHRKDDGTLWANTCPAGATCSQAANDVGLALTGDQLFAGLRKSANFRGDINTMLDRMVNCLVAGFTPDPITGFTAPADKSAGRIPASTCYDDDQPPLGYFSHYREQIFVARAAVGNLNVSEDGGAPQSCPGVLIFAGQRGAGQSRASATERNAPANYLEGTNLASFTTTGLDFAGARLFNTLASGQSASQDIVRCIPATSPNSFTPVESPTLTTEGFGQLVAYDAATGTLTLGREGVTSGAGASPGALFGCAWQPVANSQGKGFRAYFQFRFRTLGTSVGNTGFVFAAADDESYSSLDKGHYCGASASHLGYSGSNGVTPALTFPKLGIEFDQGRNTGFSEGVTNPGRRDPCGASSCGGNVGYNSHAAIVYWGHAAVNAIDLVTRPGDDDNVHGFPSAGSQAGNPRPAPQNPEDLSALPPGIALINLRTGDVLFHVRVEATPSRNVGGVSPELRNTNLVTEVWIERDSATSANLIAAMQNTTRSMAQLYPGYAAKLKDTALLYDVPMAACGAGGSCPADQACGADNVCYRQALKQVRLGFTGSQGTQDQQVDIGNFFASWLQ